MVEVVRIAELPAGFQRLVEEAAREGWRHLERLRDDWASGHNRFDQPGEGLFCARLAGELAGVCGLNVDPFAGDPRIGRVRRLYVAPARRRSGVARTLVEQVQGDAQRWFRELRLRTASREADAFFRALGFERVTGEPEHTHLLRFKQGAERDR